MRAILATLACSTSLLVACSRDATPSSNTAPNASTSAPTSVTAPITPTAAPIASTTPSAETATSAPPPSSPAPAAPPSKEVVTGANRFGFELYRKLKGAKGNLTISPSSIAVALAMTCGGAKGATAQELASVLHFACAGPDGMKRSATLSSSLERAEGVELRIANRLFGERTYPFKPTFLDATKAAYGAPLEAVDFHGNADGVRKHINGWVSDQTAHRIQELIPSGGLSPATRLVLVNALYFLGDWEHPFEKSRTAPAPFTLLDGTKATVATMRQSQHFAYADEGDATVVELPYSKNTTSMVLVVPKDAASFAKVEAALDEAWLSRALAKLGRADTVDLSLPSFVLEPAASLTLKEPLQALGLKTVFTDLADLGDIADPKDARERLQVSEVFHKTFVRVDEKGTEAAAATAVAARSMGARPSVREIKVDRPFFFAIRHRPTGALMFTGRVVDPRGGGA